MVGRVRGYNLLTDLSLSPKSSPTNIGAFSPCLGKLFPAWGTPQFHSSNPPPALSRSPSIPFRKKTEDPLFSKSSQLCTLSHSSPYLEIRLLRSSPNGGLAWSPKLSAQSSPRIPTSTTLPPTDTPFPKGSSSSDFLQLQRGEEQEEEEKQTHKSFRSPSHRIVKSSPPTRSNPGCLKRRRRKTIHRPYPRAQGCPCTRRPGSALRLPGGPVRRSPGPRRSRAPASHSPSSARTPGPPPRALSQCPSGPE